MNYKGLNKEEVDKRIKEGKVNKIKNNLFLDYFKIVIKAFFNFYNLIFYAVAIIFILYSVITKDNIAISKYGFLFVVFMNAIISLYTNIKAKRKLTKLNIINKNKYTVIRDGEEILINDDEIVLDDIILIKSGESVACDIEVIEGSINVDESMLTGESDLINKVKENIVLSGSQVINGNCVGKVTKVSKDTYINGIKSSLLKIKKKKTPLEKNLYTLIIVMICLLIPAVITVLIKTLSVNEWKLTKEVITKTATIMVGMVPIGMILLSSITLTNSVLKLFKQNVLTQDLYSIENLAKIDTLALDKTGTITTGNLVVEKIEILNEEFKENILFSYLNSFKEGNKTSDAIIKYLSNLNYKVDDKLLIEDINEFNSKNKFSSLKIDDMKYFLGVIEFIYNDKIL